MKIRSAGTENFHTVGHNEANSRFAQFCAKRLKNESSVTEYDSMQCACVILSHVACPTVDYFSTLSHKRNSIQQFNLNFRFHFFPHYHVLPMNSQKKYTVPLKETNRHNT